MWCSSRSAGSSVVQTARTFIRVSRARAPNSLVDSWALQASQIIGALRSQSGSWIPK